MFVHRAEANVDRVKDGDSIVGSRRVDPGLVLEGEPYDPEFRLLGVDTHESYEDEEKAQAQTTFTKEWIAKGEREHDGRFPFVIEYPDDQEAEGSFGRLLVMFYRKSDCRCLNQDLLDTFEGIEYE